MLTTLLAAVLSLTISPSACFEPCTLRAVIKVADPTKTHQICIHVEDSSFPVRHSCWPPFSKTNETQIANIGEGEYVVWATAKLAGGDEVATAKQQLKVIGERGWRTDDGY